MAAPAASGENRYYYRESKLIVSHSDSDSEDAYEVPPDLDSDSLDSDSDEARSPRSTSVPNAQLFADDSLPSNVSLVTSRPYPPARKSDSDSNLKSHLLHTDNIKAKQTAMVQPVQQPEIPRHTQTRTVNRKVNLAKIL